MQAQAQPIREAIVVIKEDTTMEQLQDLAHAIEELLNVKCLQIATQLENIGKKISDAESKLANIQSQIDSGQITFEEGEKQIAKQQKQLDKLNAQYDQKAQMIAEKTDEYNELISVLSAKAEYTPLKNIQVVFSQIGTPPLIGREKWAEEQNTQIREAMEQAYKAIFSQLSEDAEKQCVLVQARAAKRIDELQKTNHQMEKKNDELYRTIARKDRQLDAERVPDKDLVTDAEVWAYGERHDHYRIAFRYAGVLFNLSVSTFMERDFDLGLEARELAINHLHEVLPYCLDWDREDAESPEFRTHVAGIFFSLIDSVTTPSSSAGGGGDNSSLRWDGMNDDDEAEAQRRALFHRAYLMEKGGTGGYGRKK